jgi:nucleotide-binding universal stress UspA family protein
MKRILVCLDTSPRATNVLARAIELAKLTGAKLTLFRSVGLPPDLPHDVIGTSPNELAQRLLADARRDIERIANEVPVDHRGGAYVHVGVAWDAICNAARELDCDLVVIGSHGYGGFDRLLGTTAARVVNHADRSVLVIR